MQHSYDELVRLARLSLYQARFATDPQIAADLRSAAKGISEKPPPFIAGHYPTLAKTTRLT